MAVVKLCGLRSREDAELVNEIQPEYVGFIFAPSKRRISPCSAYHLSKIIKYSKLVGVFVNENPAVIEEVAGLVKLDAIQLHGDESDEDICRLKKSCGCEIWKVLRIRRPEDMAADAFPHADRLLVDSYAKDLRGGSGKRIDMETLQKLDVSKLFIAGGISMETVDEILALKPYGIDVSSALETDGKKDKEKVRAFMTHMNTFELNAKNEEKADEAAIL